MGEWSDHMDMREGAAREGALRSKEDHARRRAKPPAIPISAAEEMCRSYGYDQIIVIARRVGSEDEPHGEHVTTYGRNKEHCRVAAMTGNFLKHKVMDWPQLKNDSAQPLYEALKKLHREAEEQRTRLGEELPETGKGRALFDEVTAALKLYEGGHS